MVLAASRRTSTASAELIDPGDEGVDVLQVGEATGELTGLHALSACVEAVTSSGECVGDPVELNCELIPVPLQLAVAADFGKCGGVVQTADFLGKGVVTPVSTCEESEEPGRCDFSGGFSIVRTHVEFEDVGWFPWFPSCHDLHGSVAHGPDVFWDDHGAPSCGYSSGDSARVTFKAIGNALDSQSLSKLGDLRVALVVETLELDDSLPALSERALVSLGSFVDGCGQAIGRGA
jgi:hypothetical protein